MALSRYLDSAIRTDLRRKMVFIGGPRQVGKTTLVRALLAQDYPNGQYLNWDHEDDRQAILNKHWSSNAPLIAFDELHKYPHWKQWIKGIYDTKPSDQQYVVTGSARLDVYRQGGDSLLGRYHYWRLHPFTIDELPVGLSPQDSLQRLLTLGGFPEPFLNNNERLARRWRRERHNRILREDVRDLERIRDIQLLRLFIETLQNRVGSPIALSSLANDLQISPKTAKSWLQLIERMYIAFPVYPLVRDIPRAILKPVKVYFYDNADVRNGPGAQLENLIATTLLKRLHFIEDYHGYNCALHYIRDKDGREIDFATVINNQLNTLLEVKHSDPKISSALRYYYSKLKPPHCTQIVAQLAHHYDQDGITVQDPCTYFTDPPWSVLDNDDE